MLKKTAPRNVDWLLDDFVRRVVGVDRVVVLSTDGLLLGRSSGLAEADGEHLAAVASAYQSLSKGTARHFGGGGVRQTFVEMDDAFLFVTSAGQGSCLAAFASAGSDIGLVAFEMNRLVEKVGATMVAAPRTTAGTAVPRPSDVR